LLFQTPPMVPNIGPAILTLGSVCKRLSTPGQPVSCESEVASRLVVINLYSGSVSRDINLLGKAFGLRAEKASGKGIKLVMDSDVKKQHDLLLKAEASTAWDPLCAMARDAIPIIENANEPLDRLAKDLQEKTDQGEIDHASNPYELAQYLCVSVPDLITVSWLANQPSLADGIQNRGRRQVAGRALANDPSPLSQALFSKLNLKPSRLGAPFPFPPNMVYNSQIDAELRFDPLAETVDSGYIGRFGATLNVLMISTGNPFSSPAPALPAVYGGAGLGDVYKARLETTEKLLAQPVGTDAQSITPVSTWSQTLLAWDISSGRELLAPVSPVRDHLVAWPERVGQLSLSVILKGPAISKSAASNWDPEIEKRGVTWSADSDDSVLVLHNNRDFLDDLRWQAGLDSSMEERLAAFSSPHLSDLLGVAAGTDDESVAKLAAVPIFNEGCGFSEGYPGLMVLNAVSAEQREAILQAKEGEQVPVRYADAPEAFNRYLASAKAVARAIDLIVAPNGTQGLSPILQPDVDSVFPRCSLVFTWRKEDHGWSLVAVLEAPITPEGEADPTDTTKTMPLYLGRLFRLER